MTKIRSVELCGRSASCSKFVGHAAACDRKRSSLPRVENWDFNSNGQIVCNIYNKDGYEDGDDFHTNVVPPHQRFATHVVTATGSIYMLGTRAVCGAASTSAADRTRSGGPEGAPQEDAPDTQAPRLSKRPKNCKGLCKRSACSKFDGHTDACDKLRSSLPRVENWYRDFNGKLAGDVHYKAGYGGGEDFRSSCIPADQWFSTHVVTSTGSVYILGTRAKRGVVESASAIPTKSFPVGRSRSSASPANIAHDSHLTQRAKKDKGLCIHSASCSKLAGHVGVCDRSRSSLPRVENWYLNSNGQIACNIYNKDGYDDGEDFHTNVIPPDQWFETYVVTATGSIYMLGVRADREFVPASNTMTASTNVERLSEVAPVVAQGMRASRPLKCPEQNKDLCGLSASCSKLAGHGGLCDRSRSSLPRVENWYVGHNGHVKGNIYNKGGYDDGEDFHTNVVPSDQWFQTHVVTASGSIYMLGLRAEESAAAEIVPTSSLRKVRCKASSLDCEPALVASTARRKALIARAAKSTGTGTVKSTKNGLVCRNASEQLKIAKGAMVKLSAMIKSQPVSNHKKRPGKCDANGVAAGAIMKGLPQARPSKPRTLARRRPLPRDGWDGKCISIGVGNERFYDSIRIAGESFHVGDDVMIKPPEGTNASWVCRRRQ